MSYCNGSLGQESKDLFALACTGCPGTLYCLAKLEMINRSDLISRGIAKLWSKVKDTVFYEVPLLNVRKKEVIYGIIQKELKSKIEFYDDLDRMKRRDYERKFFFLSGDKGVEERVIRRDARELFRECKDTVKLVYVSSEVSIVSGSNLFFRATFEYNEKLIETQIQFVLALVNRLIELVE